ncbi:trypsin-3-like [Anoplophora glabripennis]|uniref:trypsin-3-like n=1 Tax=Anoplophora glabripennis TaxID=217634 RepID=UPI00087404AE|nr:trypsin-3-like [Anoplophora glabripennis]
MGYYFIIFVLSTYFLTAQGFVNMSRWEGTEDSCGRTMYNDSLKLERGGKYKAEVGQFPWAVRLGVIQASTKEMYFYCSGSLISRSFVLSAAHCGSHSKIARLGSNNIDEGIDCNVSICALPPQDIKIKDHIYSDHCRLSNKNDILIVALAQPAVLNDFVQPICLPKNLLSVHEKKDRMIVPGWGAAYSGFGNIFMNEVTSDLMYIESFLVDDKRCNNVYDYKLDNHQYCVRYPQVVKDPCVVDSGGAMIYYKKVKGLNRAFLVGIASHDLLKCKINKTVPIVYTNVAKISDWIPRIIPIWIESQKGKGKKMSIKNVWEGNEIDIGEAREEEMVETANKEELQKDKETEKE